MRQGTTPSHTFTLPFDTAMVTKVKITYKQEDTVVLTKETAACTMEGANVTVSLTQEETFLFSANIPVQIQVRVLTTDGEALTSDVIRVPVRVCFDDEVMA